MKAAHLDENKVTHETRTFIQEDSINKFNPS